MCKCTYSWGRGSEALQSDTKCSDSVSIWTVDSVMGSVLISVADPYPYVSGLSDADPLVRGTNPDPSIIKQNLDSYRFRTSL
jgi:hypothetical protein